MSAESMDFPAGAEVFSRRSLAVARTLSRHRWKRRLLYALVFILLVVRWFTETAGILPRSFNFADLALLGLAAALLFSGNYWRLERCRFWRLRLFPLVAAFLVVGILSVAINMVLYNIRLIPALLSLTFYLEPITFALAFIALGWNVQDTKLLAKLVVVIGVLQIPTAMLQMPKTIATGNPDLVSGTFGTDNSQMCFFIVMVVSYLAARYFMNRKKVYLLPLPALLAIFYAAGFKSLWYALPPTLAFVILAVFPLRGRQKWLLLAGLTMLMLGVGLRLGRETSRGTTTFFKKRYIENVVQSGAIWQIGKIQTFVNIARLYRQDPLAAVVGVGPGSYSDRAFFTFTQVSPDSTNRSNVTNGFVSPEEPGRFAKEYMVPLVYKSSYLFGSWTIDGPWTNYVSLLGELGIAGFALYLLVYFRLYKLASATARRAWAKRDAQLFGLSIACAIGVLILLEMSFLDNWLEVSRVTVPLWLLFVPLLQSTSASALRRANRSADGAGKPNGEQSRPQETGA